MPIHVEFQYCSFLKTIRLGNIIFILMNFSQLFSASWKHLFQNKKSFGIIFFFQIFPTIVIFVWALCLSLCAKYAFPIFSRNFDSMALLARLTTPFGLSLLAIVGLVLLLVWLTFQLICSYLSALGLAWNFQNKKYTFKTLLRSWKGMWSWAGTGLAVGVQFLGIFVVWFLLALGFAYFHEYLALVPVALTVWTFFFFAVSLSLALPIYFFEGKKYFQATKASSKLVRGRWWKTFGYAFIVIICVVVVNVGFVVLEMLASWSSQFLPPSLGDSEAFVVFLGIIVFLYYIIQMFVNTVVQVLIQSFTFALYHSYSSSVIAKSKSRK